MIKLGCNYYPEVEELISEGRIDIDFFKFPSLGYQMWVYKKEDLSDFETLMSRLTRIRPVLQHGLPPAFHSIGSSDFIAKTDMAIVRRALSMALCKDLSLHLDGIDRTLLRGENKAVLLRNIEYLKEQFPDADSISFENVDSAANFGVCAEPDFISEVILESGTRFLLDISHAYTAARETRADFQAHLDRLPLELTHEIHINGWIENASGHMSHTKINELGYQMLISVLGRCQPKYVTLEYGRPNDRIGAGVPVMSPDRINTAAKEEIVEQINRLRQILGQAGDV